MSFTLSTSGIMQAEIDRHNLLSEVKRQGHGGTRRLRRGVYPRSQFAYGNYNVDPRPDVLKLGIWIHPTTGNKLLGGVNLNYLSAGQLKRLKRIVANIFKKRTLRQRYRHLRRRLPDVAQYYRTYDEDHISAEQPDEFKAFDYRDVVEPRAKAVQAKKKVDADELADLVAEPEAEYDPEEKDDAIEKARELWQMKRRLYDPKSGRRAKPERLGIQGSKRAKREKLNRYKSQRRKLRQLERDAEIERMISGIKRTAGAAADFQSELGTYESQDYHYSPELGFTWASPTAYLRHHNAETFGLLREHCSGRVLAIHDIKSGQTIYDAVDDHVFMLHNAGWDYWHTVLMELDEGELVLRSEIPKPRLLEILGKLDFSRITRVLSE